jgi:hypothetical protein
MYPQYNYQDEYLGGGLSQECSSISESSYEFGTPQDSYGNDPFGVYGSNS